eukprot:6353068-Amphidinium_carterae.1
MNTVSGSQQVHAIVSKRKLDLGLDDDAVRRISFHVKRTVHRNGSEHETSPACVGWIHQLSSVHVCLHKPVQSATIALSASTCVLRVSTHIAYCPSDQWQAISK